MKNVLIVAYYWPPSGGPGVQRWLKFIKYLSVDDWNITVVIPENPDYQILDTTLIEEIPSKVNIIKVPIKEPFRFYKRIFQKKNGKDVGFALTSSKRNSIKSKILYWIRGNLVLPDARKFWIKPVVKVLTKYLDENKIDCIITTGPPHSLHLIGYKLKKKFNQIPWICDFRDPWTKIDFYQELNPTKLADYIQKRLEKKVVQSADSVITVSESNSEDFRKLRKENIFTITNGFDHEDYQKVNIDKLDDKFSISHIGNFMGNRNPITFWIALNELISENDDLSKDLQLRFVGTVDYQIFEDLRLIGLDKFVEKIGYVNHSKAIQYQKTSQVLLLVINKTGNPKGMLTGKLFEYLASGRPILLVDIADGDAAEIIKKTGTGIVCNAEQKEEIKKTILKLYFDYKNQKTSLERNQVEIDRFSRQELTRKLSEIMNKLIIK